MQQVFAIVWVRVRLLINTLRHKTSGWQRAAAIITFTASLLVSLGIAFGIGALTANLYRPEDPTQLANGLYVAFWVCAVFGFLMPVLVSTGASGIDTASLKGYPISRQRLFFVTWASAFASADHVFYYPTLLAAFFVGAEATRAFGPTQLLLFALVPIIIVTWSVAMLTLLQSVMRHRRGKEIMGMIGFGLVIFVSFTPSFFTADIEENPGVVEAGLEALRGPVVAVASLFPPNLAADGVIAELVGDGEGLVRSLLGLGVWLVLGLCAAVLVFRWTLRGEPIRSQSTSSGGSTPARAVFDYDRLLGCLPQDVQAVTSKELRYLMRSTVGRFNIVLLPLVCAMMLVLFPVVKEDPLIGNINGDRMTLYGLMLYALLFTNNFVSNSVGWEGTGFKVYMLSPVPFARVLVGKNIGIWIYALALWVLVIASWLVLRGMPSWINLISSALMFGGAMLLFTTAGNFSSLAFPVLRDISAMKSQPTQAAILISMFTVLGLGGTALFFVLLPSMFGLKLGPVLPLLAFFVLAVCVYRLSLGPAADLFARNQLKILEKLEAGL